MAPVMKHTVESCYKLLSTTAAYNHNISHALFLIMTGQKNMVYNLLQHNGLCPVCHETDLAKNGSSESSKYNYNNTVIQMGKV